MIVTYIHSSHTIDQIRVQVRCRNFADAINRMGAHTANLLDLNSFIQNTPIAQKICSESDLLVVNRYLFGPVLRAVQYWRARDKKVVVDFDQPINYMTPDIPGYSFWMEGLPLTDDNPKQKKYTHTIDPIPLEQFKWGLGLVDAAIVSSPRLADDWAHYSNVLEIPDYLNTDQYPALKQDHESEIWLGLCNNTKYNSLNNSGLLKALENVCKERPDLKLALCEKDSLQIEKINIPSEQVIKYRANSFEEWANILPKLDVGLVPIFGDYDVRSSWIPLLEFMVSKIPWISTDLISFRPLSAYGTLVQNSTEEWQDAISNLVDHIDGYRKKAAGEPFLFALSQDINGNIDKVLKFYTSILNQA